MITLLISCILIIIFSAKYYVNIYIHTYFFYTNSKNINLAKNLCDFSGKTTGNCKCLNLQENGPLHTRLVEQRLHCSQ